MQQGNHKSFEKTITCTFPTRESGKGKKDNEGQNKIQPDKTFEVRTTGTVAVLVLLFDVLFMQFVAFGCKLHHARRKYFRLTFRIPNLAADTM